MEKFPQARYKKFDSELDAKAFVSGFDHPGRAGNTIMSDPGRAGNTIMSDLAEEV